MFKGIEHIGIFARDSESLAKWYRETLGWRVVFDNKKTPPCYFLATPNGDMIEICPNPAAPVAGRVPAMTDPGHRHLAIAVDDFETAYAALKAKSVEFIEPPKSFDNGVQVVFFRDPEGNILHLIRRPVPMV